MQNKIQPYLNTIQTLCTGGGEMSQTKINVRMVIRVYPFESHFCIIVSKGIQKGSFLKLKY